MPNHKELKSVKDLHEGVPYYVIRKGKKTECYQLHTPWECRHIFPTTNENIHKCIRNVNQKEYIKVDNKSNWRTLIVSKKEPNYYPVVMDKGELERIKATVKTKEELKEEKLAYDEAQKKLLEESQKRIDNLKKKQQKQPGVSVLVTKEDKEIEGPDQMAHTLSRAELLKVENLPGPRLCKGIILAAKCHAIRDAQIKEKELIKKELKKEDRRLDAIMEENRLAAVERAQKEEEFRKQLRMQNLMALQEQIKARETAQVMEKERIYEDSVRINQANIAMQIEEAKKQQEKHQQQLKLKEMLDQGNEEILYFKNRALEEERIMDLRIKNFEKAKREQEDQNRAKAEAIRNMKLKDIEHISRAQKEAQTLKEELERIRNLKIQEDKEREIRKSERDKAIKKNKDMKELHEARVEQINQIHKHIAREIAQDEQAFNNACRENEEYLKKQKQLEDKRKAATERHRRELMRQINDKERYRREERERIYNEGLALRMEQDQINKYEEKIIRMKIDNMRKEKIEEKYVKEVEHFMVTSGYKV